MMKQFPTQLIPQTQEPSPPYLIWKNAFYFINMWTFFYGLSSYLLGYLLFLKHNSEPR
jgi:hypothetical protein